MKKTQRTVYDFKNFLNENSFDYIVRPITIEDKKDVVDLLKIEKRDLLYYSNRIDLPKISIE